MHKANRNWNHVKGKRDILIFDGMNLCFRNAFTIGKLKHGDIGTGVIYGCIKSVKELMARFEPQQVIIVWEGKGSRNRRRAIYPEYKANRKSTLPISKEDFYKQIESLKEVLYYLGIVSIQVEGFEADDVIAVLSRHYTNEKKKVVIVSTDEDLLQLVNMWNEIYSPVKNVVINEQNFRDVVSISLSDYLHYKCLVGDTSDNIKGVVGIGDKGARTICDFLGLPLFLEQDVATIKDKKLQHLFTPEGRAELKLAQQLIDLSDVPLTMETILDNSVNGRYDCEEVRDLLMDMDMWSILDKWEEFESVFGKEQHE